MTLIVLFCYLKPQLFKIALRGMNVATREYGLHKWDIYKSWILVCIVSSHSSRQVYIHMHIRWDFVMYAMFVVLTRDSVYFSIFEWQNSQLCETKHNCEFYHWKIEK